MWPTGAYTAAPLVDWRSENGGQYAQGKTMGIIRFVTSFSIFIQISSGCRRPIIDTASTIFGYQMAVGPPYPW